MTTVYEKLLAAKDDRYRAFQAPLVPGIPEDALLGVRTPDLRAIAREVSADPQRDEFLSSLPHRYYEENLVHFFIIAGFRDFDACVRAVDAFLPYVDCWPVSDQATPTVFRKNHEKLLPYIRKWIASDHVYTARFGIRMLMNEFLGKDFREETARPGNQRQKPGHSHDPCRGTRRAGHLHGKTSKQQYNNRNAMNNIHQNSSD